MSSSTNTNTAGRNPALDGIRGIAIIMVLFYHVLGICTDLGASVSHGKLEKILSTLFSDFWAGVDLFFVLSGFLITSILLKSKEKPSFFRNFYMRRALRIFPLYYLFLIVYFVVLPFFFPQVPRFNQLADRQLWYWTYTSNIEVFVKGIWQSPGHCWSLAIEEQFYWLWPLLVYFLPLHRLRVATIGILLIQPVLRFVFMRMGIPAFATGAFTLAHLDGLMAGGLLAIAVKEGTDFRTIRRFSLAVLIGGLAIRGMLPVLPFSYDIKRHILSIMNYSLISMAWVGLSISTPSTGKLNRLFSTRILVYFGKYSYGIYMINHQIFEFVAWKFNLVNSSGIASWTRVFIAGMAITLPLSWLLFRYFETPFLNLKDRWASEPVHLLNPAS